MRIVAHYSHLNGLEYLQVHQPAIWDEIQNIIGAVDGDACKKKRSKEKTMKGKSLYSPKEMNTAIKKGLMPIIGKKAGSPTG